MTREILCNYPKIQTKLLNHREMCPKDADGMANSVDPDKIRVTAFSKNIFPSCGENQSQILIPGILKHNV